MENNIGFYLFFGTGRAVSSGIVVSLPSSVATTGFLARERTPVRSDVFFFSSAILWCNHQQSVYIVDGLRVWLFCCLVFWSQVFTTRFCSDVHAFSTQRYVVVGTNHLLLRVANYPMRENSARAIFAVSAQGAQFSHLVANRNEVKYMPKPLLLKVSVKSTYVHHLSCDQKAFHKRNDRLKELTFVDKHHIGGHDATKRFFGNIVKSAQLDTWNHHLVVRRQHDWVISRIFYMIYYHYIGLAISELSVYLK